MDGKILQLPGWYNSLNIRGMADRIEEISFRFYSLYDQIKREGILNRFTKEFSLPDTPEKERIIIDIIICIETLTAKCGELSMLVEYYLEKQDLEDELRESAQSAKVFIKCTLGEHIQDLYNKLLSTPGFEKVIAKAWALFPPSLTPQCAIIPFYTQNRKMTDANQSPD